MNRRVDGTRAWDKRGGCSVGGMRDDIGISGTITVDIRGCIME